MQYSSKAGPWKLKIMNKHMKFERIRTSIHIEYDSYDIYSHSWGSMVVADGLAPIWCQDIYNHHDDIGQLANVSSGVSQHN